MGKSFAPKEMTYKVYRQDTPVFVGKDRMGDDQFRANLVEVGYVIAKSTARAFELARDYTKFPVLEKHHGL